MERLHNFVTAIVSISGCMNVITYMVVIITKISLVAFCLKILHSNRDSRLLQPLNLRKI